jgi:hypothetical protein
MTVQIDETGVRIRPRNGSSDGPTVDIGPGGVTVVPPGASAPVVDIRVPKAVQEQIEREIAREVASAAREAARAEREALRAKLKALFDGGEFLPDAHGRVTRLEFGPPVGYPVQFRLLGPEPAELRRLAEAVRAEVRKSPLVRDVQLDWFEQVRRIEVEVNRSEAARAGISPADVQQAVQLALSGAPVTSLRVGEELIDVVLRGNAAERLSPEQLGQLQLFSRSGALLPPASRMRRPSLASAGLWSMDRPTGARRRRPPPPTILPPPILPRHRRNRT